MSGGGKRAYNRFGVPVLVEVREVVDPIDNPDLIAAAEDFCLAESPEGYVCSEEPGHDSWHRATAADLLFDTWPPEEL